MSMMTTMTLTPALPDKDASDGHRRFHEADLALPVFGHVKAQTIG